jgi:hypothetical protein
MWTCGSRIQRNFVADQYISSLIMLSIINLFVLSVNLTIKDAIEFYGDDIISELN